VERSRAADDFEVIRGRLEELRREREEISSTTSSETPNNSDSDAEQRRQEHCDGTPPSWVPTIFLPQPTD
jgi:hypothetical protein